MGSKLHSVYIPSHNEVNFAIYIERDSINDEFRLFYIFSHIISY
jgi:hypothetical protein